ncbi:hypothetical protein [Dactylosporangium sp. NPDC005555]|uniref:hypothetical protein n=1 Tax=Dactylosporangium sp. NPDC005555 TaxID=3154889 RepID=UPI0033BCE736
MNVDPVVVAVLAAFQMLDDASEDQVDPRFAVRAQQAIGAYLDELSSEDVAEFRRILSRIAGERAETDPVIARYARMLAAGLASGG